MWSSFLLWCVPSAWSQSVTTTMTPGTEVLVSSTGYNAATGVLQLGGTVEGVTAATVGNYRVLVQGTPFTPSWTGARAEWTGSIDLSPGALATWYPFADAYLDESWMEKPVLIELTNPRRTRVFDREMTWVSDERTDEDVELLDPDEVGFYASGAQLTEAGLDAVEPELLLRLPWPTASAYESDVFALLADEPARSYEGLGACRPLSEVSGLLGSDAYTEAYALSLVSYAAYLTVRAAGLPRARELCVTSPPIPGSPDNWEVCVDTISGTAVDATVEAVDTVDFGFSGGGLVASIGLTNPAVVVDVELSEVTLRWSAGGTLCTTLDRPSATLDFTAGSVPEEYEGWNECPSLTASAAGATTSVQAEMSAGVAAGGDARLDVLAASPPELELYDLVVDAGVDACGDEFIVASVEALLGEFHEPLESALGPAWEPGVEESPVDAGDHGGSAAIDALLTGWELEPACDAGAVDVVIDLGLHEVSWRHGVAVSLYSETESPLSVELDAVKAHRPGGAPVSGDGTSPEGDEFDVMASVSTLQLSQALTALGSEALSFNPADEWGDLEVDPTSLGLAADAAVAWNGTSLGAWNAAFAVLGTREVEFSLTPSYAPWAWMNPDGPDPSGAVPIGLSAPAMTLTVTEPATSRVWLEAEVYFHDPDLQVTVGGGLFADIDLGSPVVYVTVMSSQLGAGCPAVAHSNVAANVPTACERVLETALVDVLQPQIEARVLGMLDEIPMPSVYDFAGTGSALELETVGYWRDDQYVSWYGRFL